MGEIIKKNIAIIGAGIIGCAAARELCRYRGSVIVIEKEADVSLGTTKGNSGIIHAGYAGDKGTLRFKLSHRGNVLFRKYAPELDIHIKNTGSLAHVQKKSQLSILEELLENGKKNGAVGLEIITDSDTIKKIEPNIGRNIYASLHAREACIISPYEAAIALYENAKRNLVDFLFGSKVTDISYDKSRKTFFIKTPSQTIEADFVINAAGVHSDDIARMIGDKSFYISPYRGQYLLFDSEAGEFVNCINFRVSAGKSKGITIVPTIDGNLLTGPNYEKTCKDGSITTVEGLEEVRGKASQIFPDLPYEKIITSFSGLRAISGIDDFIISSSCENKRFINAAGIQSPGLTCAFVIAEIIIEILKDLGAGLKKNSKFIPVRKKVPRFDMANISKNKKLFKINNQYSNIICRCEKVTEAEIVGAIKSGATTVDGIKFRTRAGMGRCQGGYCRLRVMKILSRELKIPFEKVTKSGKGSYIAGDRMN